MLVLAYLVGLGCVTFAATAFLTFMRVVRHMDPSAFESPTAAPVKKASSVEAPLAVAR
ncbi:MAG TPA: hypothetical protein VJP86_04000 [Vicinamibacterales bacterium]|nr:hypothetical protein [Vicinamibacterales bacterium]